MKPITTEADKADFLTRLRATMSQAPARTIRRTAEGYPYCTHRLRDTLATK